MRTFLRKMRFTHHVNSGEEPLEIGNYERAMDFYQKSLEYDEDPTTLYSCIKHSLVKLGEYEEL